MIKLKNTLCAFLALSFAAGTAVPLSAAPLVAPRVVQEATGTAADVTNVQYRERRAYRDRREYRNRYSSRDRFDDRRGYYRGHRGYRYKRPGYRYYNGYWFPAAAFITGAIIGGVLNNNRTVVVEGGDSHVRWCENRWRSYRAYDNTYQPLNGPRRICVSPYG